jgi:glycosyltransferase involved in cell wall biosynthesis
MSNSATSLRPHIVIDARLYGPKHTGIGRYTKNLLIALKKVPQFNQFNFTVIVYPENYTEAKRDLKPDFNIVTTNIKHYSIAEQIKFPFFLSQLHPSLVHFTNSYQPLFYFGKSVTTIHDLIRHFSKGKETTTKNPLLYWPKYLAYLLITTLTIRRSKIIVPSNYWRNYLIKNYKINPDFVSTTYEAIDPKFLGPEKAIVTTPKPYVIYTGNLYPHKNIDVVLKALKSLPSLKLKVISARSVFSGRLEILVDRYHVKDQVDLLGYIKDADFFDIYSQATCLVHPAFIEGFSLTGLEAMALNCPVVSSNSSCLPEIYGDSVMYFNPHKSRDLVKCLKKIQNNPKLRTQMINKGRALLKKYSWNRTAQQTYDIYKQTVANNS